MNSNVRHVLACGFGFAMVSMSAYTGFLRLSLQLVRHVLPSIKKSKTTRVSSLAQSGGLNDETMSLRPFMVGRESLRLSQNPEGGDPASHGDRRDQVLAPGRWRSPWRTSTNQNHPTDSAYCYRRRPSSQGGRLAPQILILFESLHILSYIYKDRHSR